MNESFGQESVAGVEFRETNQEGKKIFHSQIKVLGSDPEDNSIAAEVLIE